MAEYSGEYGGTVKRGFSGDGKKWIAGAILKPEDVAHWPLANKITLHKNGNIDWFGPPVVAEQEAREAGKPAPARGKVAPEPKAPPTAPKPKGGRPSRTVSK